MENDNYNKITGKILLCRERSKYIRNESGVVSRDLRMCPKKVDSLKDKTILRVTREKKRQ